VIFSNSYGGPYGLSNALCFFNSLVNQSFVSFYLPQASLGACARRCCTSLGFTRRCLLVQIEK